jgi:hypothetical protein
MNSTFLSLCLVAAVGVDQAPADVPPPKPVEPAPMIQVAPAMIECPRPSCISDFCHSFVPMPGTYEVLFIHPVKGCPVWVCFNLPANCCPPKICCSNREIVFDYGCKKVVIKFKILCGKVAVLYA